MQALAPAGQKALRQRLQLKKERAKVMAAGARKHEQALQQMNQRRAEQLTKARPAPVAYRTNQGVSSGIKTRNKHLQEFENIKKSYGKRKGKFCITPLFCDCLL